MSPNRAYILLVFLHFCHGYSLIRPGAALSMTNVCQFLTRDQPGFSFSVLYEHFVCHIISNVILK